MVMRQTAAPVVVVTSPAAQAERLLELLRERGYTPRPLPLLRIETRMSADEVAARLAEQADAAVWIFTSVNAVSALGEHSFAAWPAQVAAIGPATAARLAERGIEAWTATAGSDSEALLADPRLAEVAGQRVVVVTGEGGRPLLAETLRARGAELTVLPVYRRVPVDTAPETLHAALQGADLIQFSSAEAMDHFVRLVADPARRHALQWLVSSPRLADHARRLGYPREPRVTAGPADEDVLAAVTSILETTPAMSDAAAPPPEVPAAEAKIPKAKPATSTAAGRATTRRSGAWAWLLLLGVAVLLALLLRAAWPQWQALQQTLAEQQSALAALAERQASLDDQATDLLDVQQQASQDAARLRERLETYDEVLARLSDEVGGGRERVVMSTAEQLMMIANDRLLLAGDVQGAREALALADERLARLADPRLHGVRAALAEERAALAALPVLDTAGVALRLDAAIQQSARLPLQRSPVYAPPPAVTPEGAGALQSAWQKLRAAAAQLFVLRRADAADWQARLPETEEGLIRGLLQLKLENARGAWLRRDGEAYATVLASARDWLSAYFQTAAPEVMALDAELEGLAQLPLQIEAPELSRSLRLLRAQLEPTPR
jgi:uncharacterized protein HemX/uroporphyrinogen-III synthase